MDDKNLFEEQTPVAECAPEVGTEAAENETETEIEAVAAASDEMTAAHTEEITPAASSEINEAKWYGISYGAEQTSYTMMQTTKKHRKKKQGVALVACALLLCVVLSGVAGFGGYLLGSLVSKEPVSDDGGFHPSGDDGGSTVSGDVYGNDGAEDYTYAGVTISKNDGAGLAGSKNGSAGNAALSLTEAIAAVRDSVVEIVTTTTSYRGQLVSGAGSGVIIHADGIIVTNHHVIDGVDTIYVRLTNGNTYEAYLRGTDDENDVAVLKITPRETLTVAKLGCSKALVVGEDVFAIGNPLGQLGGTVTDGIISALEREVEMEEGTMTLLQTNAAINSGNSGGGLFNMAGELIGVVNAKYSATGVEGLGFAIPVDSVVLSINALLQNGYVPGRPTLGVDTAETTVLLGGKFTSMPYVYAAPENSPFRVGDYIYQIGDTTVSTSSELKRAVRGYNVGDTVQVVIYRQSGRNTEKMTITVTLSEYVPADSELNFIS